MQKVQARKVQKIENRASSKSVIASDVSETLLQYKETNDKILKYSLVREIVNMCYGSKHNQLYLANILGVPFCPGPVTINKIPTKLLERPIQLMRLFRFLQKVKEYYACWIIFHDEELGILNLKLFTKFQFDDFNQNLDEDEFVIGIFIGKKPIQKSRTKSTTAFAYINQQQKLNCSAGLSTKTTADSTFLRKQKKQTKSISMKGSEGFANGIKARKKIRNSSKSKTINPFLKKNKMQTLLE